MVQRVYATAADFYDYVGDAQPMITPEPTEEDPNPDPVPLDDATLNATLRRASIAVEGHLRLARYVTDEDGYPEDPEVADALRDATCAYVAFWVETGDITGAGALSGPVKIGSVTLGGTVTGGASSRTVADARRSDEAVQILRNAGLITATVSHS